MKEPRRFGLTERQIVAGLSFVGLMIVGALGLWAKSSTAGFIALYVIDGVAVTALVIHRVIAGHWIDGSR